VNPGQDLQTRATSLKQLLQTAKKEIEAALPRHLTPERMLRIAMTEARKTPKLLECTQTSFLGAIIQAAQIGLEPGGALGHCYLVPFKNDVTLIVGYRGFIELANRSERVSSVIARAVYDGDEFRYEFGLNEVLVHRPAPSDKRGKLTNTYCVVTLKDGAKMFEVLTIEDIEAARNRSRSKDNGPWKTDYDAMAKKTAVRRLFKYMPASIELQQAVGIDEQSETDAGQNLGSVLEAEGRPVNESAALDAAIAESEARGASRPVSEEAKAESKALFGEPREPGSDG
jgi:recombination protein RecT